MELEMYDKADSYYKKSLEYENASDGIANTYNSLAILAAIQKKMPQNRALLDKGLAILKEEKNEYTALLLESYGFFYEKTDFQIALNYYQKALQDLIPDFKPANDIFALPSEEELKKSFFKDRILSCLIRKSYVLQKLAKKDLKKYSHLALDTYLLTDKLVDMMRNEHESYSSKVYWRENIHKFYENALELCFQMNYLPEAFYFMEKSRAILLLDALRGLENERVKSYTIHYNMALQRKNFLNRVLSAIPTSNAFWQQAKKEWRAEDEKLKNYQNSPIYETIEKATQYVGFDTFRKWTKKNNRNFVEYFIGDSTVYALAIQPDTAILIKIDAKAYKEWTKMYAEIVRKNTRLKEDREAFLKISHQVYKLIFEPLRLPENQTIIATEGVFFPFDALVASENRDTIHYLLNDYAFSYAYSANVLMNLKQEKTKTTQSKTSLLIFAPVQYPKKWDLPPLTESADYAQKLHKKYGGDLFLAEKAIKSNFSKMINREAYHIIQLFTHGLADASQEPTIYFADSTLLATDLIQSKAIRANMVILSACETGVGDAVLGEGVMSLARSFTYSGVPTTIASLWSINASQTYILTEKFYDYLVKGMPKDIALQHAKLYVLYHTDEVVLPYFWAAPQIFGDASSDFTYLYKQNRNYLISYFLIGIWAMLFFLLLKNYSLRGFEPPRG